MSSRRGLWGAAVVLAALGLVAAGEAWKRYRAEQWLTRFQAESNASGIHVEIEPLASGWLGEREFAVRARRGRCLAWTAPRVTVTLPWLGRPAAFVPDSTLSLACEPTVLWHEWRAWSVLEGFEKLGSAAGSRPVIVLGNVNLEYRDRSVGHLSARGIERREAEGEEHLRAREWNWEGKRWTETELAVTAADRVIKVTSVSGAARVTLRYIASQSGAAEWALDVPNQPLATVLSALDVTPIRVPEDARAGVVTSVVIPDEPRTAPVANAQLILDRWPRPSWPEASALTGASGAIAMRVTPDSAAGSFRVTRVEVAAALFALSGAGSLDVRGGLRFHAEARGSRSCQELAALLPASTHRDKVRAHVAAHTTDERVELSLSIELQDRSDGKNAEPAGLRFAWHLAAGCGLDELPPDPP